MSVANLAQAPYPKRIVSLAAEGAEILDRLGAFELLVGVSGFTRRPAKARTLPRVGGFATPDLDKVLALEPDLVITTSDIQADVAARLIARGVSVLALTPHTLEGVWRSILLVGGAVGHQTAAEALVTRLQTELATIRDARPLPRRVRVFFEEWPDPLVSGIGWVGDLIEFLGGEEVFPELRHRRIASERVVTREEVARRVPDVIIASWCGRRARLDEIRARPEWQGVSAVRHGHIYEVPSELILQAGPGLVEGARRIHAILWDVATGLSAEEKGKR